MEANRNFLAEKGIFFSGAAQNFANGDQTDLIYTIELDNVDTSADDQVIAIAPGDNYTASQLSTLLGTTVNAVIADGVIVSTTDKVVNCAGTPGKLLSFSRRIRRAPQRFAGLTVEVSQAGQLTQPFKVYKDDPFIGDPVIISQIYPNKAKSNTQNNDKLVHIPLQHFQMDGDTIIVFTLKAGGTISMSFVPEGHASLAEMLQNEAVKEFADRSIVRKYGA